MRQGTSSGGTVEVVREILTSNERVKEERESSGEEARNRGDQIWYRRRRGMTRVRNGRMLSERGLEGVKKIGHVIRGLTTNEVVRNIRLANIEVTQDTFRVARELSDGVSQKSRGRESVA